MAGQRVEAYLGGPTTERDPNGYRVGDEVVVSFTGQPDGTRFVAVTDRWRLPQLAWLTAIFAAAVALAGGVHGLRALLALVLGAAIVMKLLVPLVLQGVPPIPLALAVSGAITFVTISLTEGITRASLAALLGTFSGLAVTGVAAGVANEVARFTNVASSELIYLQTAGGGSLDLRGLLLAAFIVGAVGVLDDVTVSQAATVDELAKHSVLRGRPLFLSALRVGRSHIAATVNTLFLAYLGAGLPLLVLFAVSRQPPASVLNGEIVAVEIVRTLVGSLGIVATVPLTTLIATWLTGVAERRVASAPESPARTSPVLPGHTEPAEGVGRGWVPRGARGSAAVAVALCAVAVVLFVAGPQLRPSTPLPTGPPPGHSPALGLASSLPAVSSAPGGQPGSPAPAESPAVGVPVDLVAGGEPLGSVTVLGVEEGGAASGATPRPGSRRLVVHVRYTAATTFSYGPGDWVVLDEDGREYTPAAASRRPRLLPGVLPPGETREGWVSFDVPAAERRLWLDFRNPDGSVVFSVPLDESL